MCLRSSATSSSSWMDQSLNKFAANMIVAKQNWVPGDSVNQINFPQRDQEMIYRAQHNGRKHRVTGDGTLKSVPYFNKECHSLTDSFPCCCSRGQFDNRKELISKNWLSPVV